MDPQKMNLSWTSVRRRKMQGTPLGKSRILVVLGAEAPFGPAENELKLSLSMGDENARKMKDSGGPGVRSTARGRRK